MKKIYYEILLFMCMTIVFFGGCSGKVSEEDIKMDKTETVGIYASGNIYELTDNNFQEGINYDFSLDELQKIEKMLQQVRLKKSINVINRNNILYIASFYNEKEEEILSLAIDRKFRIYSEDGMRIRSKELEKYLKNTLSK